MTLDSGTSSDRILHGVVYGSLICAFTSGLSVELGGLTLTAAHGVTLVLAGYLVAYAAFSQQKVRIIYRDDVSMFLYLIFFTNLFSTLLNSPNRQYSLRGCVVLMSMLLLYTVVRSGIRLTGGLKAVNRLKLFNWVSAAFGLACLVVATMTGSPNLGVSFGHLAIGMETLGEFIPPSIRSFSLEPNLFAIGTGTVLSLSIGRYLMGDRAAGILVWMMVPAIAILFAYTRSVYVALAMTVFVLMILARQTRALVRMVSAGVVVVGIGFALGLVLPENHPAKKAAVERVSTLMDFQSGTGEGRLLGYQAAWKSYLTHPIVGNGTFSADTRAYNPYTGAYQERMGAAGWLTGSVIQALHDTGLVGLAVLLGLFLMLLLKNYRAFRRLPIGDPNKGLILGFIGGNLVLIITSQLSSPLLTAFPYVFWAVNMEFLHVLKCNSESASARKHPSRA